jgi:hypothetical protein
MTYIPLTPEAYLHPRQRTVYAARHEQPLHQLVAPDMDLSEHCDDGTDSLNFSPAMVTPQDVLINQVNLVR